MSTPIFNSSTTSWDVINHFKSSLKGKTVLLTGPTEGIGKATAKALASLQPKLILVVRNEEKGKALVTELAEFKNDDIHLVYADLANLATVRTVKSQLEKLNIKEINHAIFNAGVFHGHAYSTTKDNLEKHFGINHIGHFQLWLEIQDYVIAASMHDEARIVVVSSESHQAPRSIDWSNVPPLAENFGWFALYGANKAYEFSKLCNNLFSNYLANEFKQKKLNITINSLHPGSLVLTGIFDSNVFLKTMARGISYWTKTLDQSAATTINCVVNPDLKGVSGSYFDSCNPKRQNPVALNEENQQKLWSISNKLCGVVEPPRL